MLLDLSQYLHIPLLRYRQGDAVRHLHHIPADAYDISPIDDISPVDPQEFRGHDSFQLVDGVADVDIFGEASDAAVHVFGFHIQDIAGGDEIGLCMFSAEGQKIG